MKTWKIELEVKVADSWIADGFNMNERLEDLQDQVKNMLPFAYGHEIKVKAIITKAPTKKEIKDLQDGTVEIKD